MFLILFRKLNVYGLGGAALSVIKSSHTSKKGLCRLRSMEPLRIPCLLSLVSPRTLFLIKINNLDESGKSLMFTDDTTLLAARANLEEIRDTSEQQLLSATKLVFC